MEYNNIMKIFKPVLVLIIFLLGVSCKKNNDVIFAVQNERYKELFRNFIAYNDYNVKIIDNGNYLTIKNSTMDMWVGMRNIIKLEMDTINNNIANASTTRTINGGPFIRQFVAVNVENGVEIISDTSSLTRFVYDPTHPDAIQTGERQGYVECPNVNTTVEMINLIEASNFYESITEYIKANYKNVIY